MKLAGFFIYFESTIIIPMKKKVFVVLSILILGCAAFFTWGFFGPSTAFEGDKYYLYIRTGMHYDQLLESMEKDKVLKNPSLFSWLAQRMEYPANIKAGKYEMKSGMSLISILRMLRNGRQVAVNLVITKLRTREDLASLVGRKLECDSISFLSFLENEDSLKEYRLDSNTVMASIFPDTYTYFWNSTPSKVFRKLYASYKNFWTPQRVQEAREHGLNPITAYIMASIVEEETNRKEDKGKVASVYLNRMGIGMKLAADPTVKFALKNFELKRIYDKYLIVESPYNTYRNEGLPPGPICTPSEETLDAVLTAPKTNFLYFVAKPDFSGYSNFSDNYAEHLKNARAYQKALDEQMKIGQEAKDQPAK
jgi:UPF0755 protein